MTTRAALSREYGGNPQGGICRSRKTPNVLVYSDPERGNVYGYDYDGWDPNRPEMFRYTGDGQVGDQRLDVGGNRAILEHRETGHALRLFVASGLMGNSKTKLQRYVGQFQLPAESGWDFAPALDVEGNERTVIVFSLEPIGVVDRETVRAAVVPSESEPLCVVCDPEAHDVVETTRRAITASAVRRKESDLVKRFEAWLTASGHDARRLKIRPPGQLAWTYTDTYDVTAAELVEAKSDASRGSIRLAVGQLLDYRRHVDVLVERATVLVPERPIEDLVVFMRGLGIGCIHPEGDGFTRV